VKVENKAKTEEAATALLEKIEAVDPEMLRRVIARFGKTA